MATSEAQKKASAKWNAENMKTISIKVRNDMHERLKAKALERGESVHSIVKAALDEYLKEN